MLDTALKQYTRTIFHIPFTSSLKSSCHLMISMTYPVSFSSFKQRQGSKSTEQLLKSSKMTTEKVKRGSKDKVVPVLN
jgi:hypothetical protein